jgi:uncharacterized ion transporter superfamily protein YfcC
MIGWMLAIAGFAAGSLQAALLARAARGTSASAVHVLVRLLLVGGILLVAARTGNLLVGAVGWLSGFTMASALLYLRLR